MLQIIGQDIRRLSVLLLLIIGISNCLAHEAEVEDDDDVEGSRFTEFGNFVKGFVPSKLESKFDIGWDKDKASSRSEKTDKPTTEKPTKPSSDDDDDDDGDSRTGFGGNTRTGLDDSKTGLGGNTRTDLGDSKTGFGGNTRTGHDGSKTGFDADALFDDDEQLGLESDDDEDSEE